MLGMGLIALALLGSLNVVAAVDGESDPAVESCRAVAGGRIVAIGEEGRDHFAGVAIPLVSDNSGPAEGFWQHTTFEGDRFRGEVEGMACMHAGGDPADPPPVYSNYALIMGRGQWNGEDGFSFEVSVWDHGEPGAGPGPAFDYYIFGGFDSEGNPVT
jgi:hypothetical protein